MVHILVVEDDRDLNEALCRFLDAHGYQVTGCPDARRAYDCLYADSVDLIVSDVMMPGIDGLEFARTVRSQNREVPILLLTAREDFATKERGFHLGVDDYLVKPVDFAELLLHIEALLRRAHIAADRRLVVGNLVLDEDAVSATVDGVEVPLTLREFQIIFKLLSYPNRAFTRSQLLDEFSGAEGASGLRSVDVFISSLRSKLAACDGFTIATVRGLGYKAVVG